MLVDFARAYPRRSAVVLLALLVAGLLDGLGLSALLSMLQLATGAGEDPSLPERIALTITARLGLQPSVEVLLALGIGLIAIKAVVVLLANRQVGYAVAHVATDLRLMLLNAVMKSRWRYYLAQPLGRLSNAVATEAQRASEGYLHGALMATQLINAGIFTALALLISWQASLLALAAGSVLLGLLQGLVLVAGRAGRKQTMLLRSMLTVMTDQLGAVKPLKAMAREGQVDNLLATQTRKLNKALRRQVFSREGLSALQEPLLAILVGIGFFVFLVRLDMPLASVVVLLFLLARVVNHLAKAQRNYQHIAISESAYWSLREAIEAARAEQEPRRGSLEPSLEREIRFEQVSFRHDTSPILDEQSFVIPAGRLTVITGPSGSGKTTLIDLVVGLLHPDSGRILIDGVSLEDIDHYRWRRMIGYVPQDPLLVNDTVLRNVTLGEEGLDEDAAARALEAADAREFVEQLPQGLHTVLGERGGKLSGGQRQRLAIARALVHQPRLLVLDEATSNLDQQSESAVLETIGHLRGSLTLLAVSHDQALVRAADLVYFVDGGRLTGMKDDDAGLA